MAVSFQPAAASSLATRRTRAVVSRALGWPWDCGGPEPRRGAGDDKGPCTDAEPAEGLGRASCAASRPGPRPGLARAKVTIWCSTHSEELVGHPQPARGPPPGHLPSALRA